MELAVIDIGGTAIKYGRWTEHGVTAVQSVTTDAHEGAQRVVERVKACIESLVKALPVDGIAVSTAGTVDATTGKIRYATEAIPGYSDYPLKDVLYKHFRVPVSVENDVHCAALSVLPTLEFHDSALILTLGTGIGGSLVVGGELYKGQHALAGAIGHMVLYPQGELCSCGRRGCYEQYASVSALSRRIWEANGRPLPVPVFFDHLAENADFQAVFSRWIDDVATGLASAIHLLAPKVVYIGGGITAQQDVLFGPLESAVASKLLPSFTGSVAIRPIAFGNDANLDGAARHYLTHYRR